MPPLDGRNSRSGEVVPDPARLMIPPRADEDALSLEATDETKTAPTGRQRMA
ncbi:hypothetical protein [Halococcus salsus]|uniref:hypothetical protein n=1 Tax=Halococcus salsus TaxID=2162894 RepID=UPI001358B5B7|nr:hypothetical protein [Halococcus salsus]